MPIPMMRPLELTQQSDPFSRANWVFEIKYHGFRALAYVENGACRLVSRKGVNCSRFNRLAQNVVDDVDAAEAVLDGEIVVLPELKPG